jgi:hypothetical protein
LNGFENYDRQFFHSSHLLACYMNRGVVMKGVVVIADQRRARFAAQMADCRFVGFELWDNLRIPPGTVIEAEGPERAEAFFTDDGLEIPVSVGAICATRDEAYAWAVGGA